jgi:hypothetical protein
LLSSSIDGFIYAWSIHGNGGLLGKFSVDNEVGESVVGAMATDENDWILLTGDSKGNIKVRKDGHQPGFWLSLLGIWSLSASYSLGYRFHTRRWWGQGELLTSLLNRDLLKWSL